MTRVLLAAAVATLALGPCAHALSPDAEFGAHVQLVGAAIDSLTKTLAESRGPLRRLDDLCVSRVKQRDLAERDVEALAEDVLRGRFDVTQRDAYGRNALHLLADDSLEYYGYQDLPSATPRQIQLCRQIGLALVELGADANARDNRGWTPLQLAARYPVRSQSGWEPSALYQALVKAGGDEQALSPSGKSAKALLAEAIEQKVHPKPPYTDEELCQIDAMMCRR